MTSMDTRSFGSLGEDAAAKFLENNGFRIIARNVYVGHAEIDIIAENDIYIIFVEVKTRRQIPDRSSPFGTPSDAVNHRKKDMLVRGAEGYLAANPTEKFSRIDVIEVYADPRCEEFCVTKIIMLENAVKKSGKFSKHGRKSSLNHLENED